MTTDNRFIQRLNIRVNFETLNKPISSPHKRPNPGEIATIQTHYHLSNFSNFSNRNSAPACGTTRKSCICFKGNRLQSGNGVQLPGEPDKGAPGVDRFVHYPPFFTLKTLKKQ